MIGEQINLDMILRAYQQGIFPMAMEDGTIAWFESEVRALFPMSGVHVSASLRKVIRRGQFEVRFDTSFEQVMRCCQRPGDNWITEPLIQVYTEAFLAGWGHCGECWRNGKLVGGIYGIALGSCFSAESMFHRETNASKVALHAMVERCRELGFTMFDAQIMNSHLKSMGAYPVPRAEYHKQLRLALAHRTSWSHNRV